MAAGSIIIELLMKTGSIETDTARAAKSLRKLEAEAVAAAKATALAFAGIAGAAAAAFLAFDQIAGTVGKFKDLGEVMGDTAEAVAGLQTASDVSGQSMDTVTAASVKLTAALSKTDDEAKGAGAALAALNLPLEEFKRLSPVAQLEAVAKALAGFQDGAEKTAVAVALFGKSGAQLLPFLNELNAQGGRNVILTQQQIEAADNFADSTTRLKSQFTQLGQAIFVGLLPPFQAVVDEMTNADKSMTAFAAAGEAVKTVFETIVVLGANVVFVFKGIGTEIGGIAAQLVALAKFDIKGFNAISESMKADAQRARAELDKFEQAVLKPSAVTGSKPTGTLPQINTAGLAVKTAGSKDDPAKKLLENDLKAIEALVKREQDTLADRNKFLNIFNDQGLLSIQSYYDAQRTIIEAATSAQIALYAKEIQALQDFQAKKTTSQKDKADAQGKINDLLEKQFQLEQDAGQKGLELSIKQADAQRKLAAEVENVNIQLLEMQGNFAAAAAARFDQQNGSLKIKLELEGDTEALGKLNKLRNAAISQASFAEEVRKSDKALAELGMTTDRIALKQQAGAVGQLQALQLLGVERQKTIAQLEGIVAAEEAEARASRNQDLILHAQQARLELDKLKAAADPLGDKFKDIFENSLTSPLEDFIKGTKTASQAFRAFAASIGDELLHIATQDVTKQISGAIFGSGGKGGSAIGDFFKSVFGGGGQASGILPGEHDIAGMAKQFGGAQAGTAAAITTAQAAATAAITAAQASSAAAIVAGTTASETASAGLIVAAIGSSSAAIVAAITASAAASGASGAASAFDFLASLEGFASGGMPPVGKASWVGENGPELLVPRTAGTIVPMSKVSTGGNGGDTFNQHFAITGPVDRRTMEQIAAEASRGLLRARARATA